jgi:hypothetical protein
MSVREIVQRAGARLPSRSKTPDTVVARDLALDIKRKGDSSRFARTSPGRYTLRTLAATVDAPETVGPSAVVSVLGAPSAGSTGVTAGPTAGPSPLAASALKQERAAALPAKLGGGAKAGSAQAG